VPATAPEPVDRWGRTAAQSTELQRIMTALLARVQAIVQPTGDGFTVAPGATTKDVIEAQYQALEVKNKSADPAVQDQASRLWEYAGQWLEQQKAGVPASEPSPQSGTVATGIEQTHLRLTDQQSAVVQSLRAVPQADPVARLRLWQARQGLLKYELTDDQGPRYGLILANGKQLTGLGTSQSPPSPDPAGQAWRLIEDTTAQEASVNPPSAPTSGTMVTGGEQGGRAEQGQGRQPVPIEQPGGRGGRDQGAVAAPGAPTVSGTEEVGGARSGVAPGGPADQGAGAGYDEGRGAPAHGLVAGPAHGGGARAGLVDQGVSAGGNAETNITPRTVEHQAQPDSPATPGVDYVITEDDRIGEGGNVQKYRQNVEAIKLLQRIWQEHRHATPEEQALLVKYVGWGGLAESFKPSATWEDWTARTERASRYKELHDLLGEEAFNQAANSTRAAHYTAPPVVQAMWHAAARLGIGNLQKVRALEPSAGIGHFLGLMPRGLHAKTVWSVGEYDVTTAGILEQLYPNADHQITRPGDVRRTGFQDAAYPEGAYDLVISNIPFVGSVSDLKVGSQGIATARMLSQRIDGYFFAKALDKARPGGVIAFITTTGTLNSPQMQRVRDYLADRVELLGAYRMPGGTFMKNAGTMVVSDMVFMRKLRPGESPTSREWAKTVERTQDIPGEYKDADGNYRSDYTYNVSRYFVDHPENILGTVAFTGSMYPGQLYNVEPDTTRPFEEQLTEALDRLPENVVVPYVPETRLTPTLTDPRIVNAVKESAYVFAKDESGVERLYVRHGGKLLLVERKVGLEAFTRRVRGMLDIRDQARNLLALERTGAGQDEIVSARQRLNQTYDAFVVQYGPLNIQANQSAIGGDPDAFFLRGIEDWDDDRAKRIDAAIRTKDGLDWSRLRKELRDETKMPMFRTDVVAAPNPVVHVDSVTDALLVSLDQRGGLDPDYLAQLTGRPKGEVIQELIDKGLILIDPQTETAVLAEEYLAGNVKEKLRIAELFARKEPRYEANVKALRAALPADVRIGKIQVMLGAPWVPASDYTDFANQLLETRVAKNQGVVQYSAPAASFSWQKEPKVNGAVQFSKWGTSRVGADDLLMLALNGKHARVTDPGPDNTRIFNPSATTAALGQQDAIRAEFQQWIWADSARAERLAKKYNDELNTHRDREWDGSHLTFPGMTKGTPEKPFSLHKWQKNAAWRMIRGGPTLLAHGVGTGKTYSMIAAAMEKRRLGLARKNLLVVPNSVVEQSARMWRFLYPDATLLVVRPKDFDKDNRNTLMARIATGDWDGVIIAHSQLIKLGNNDAVMARFINDQLQEMRDILHELDEEQRRQGNKPRRSRGSPEKVIQARIDAMQKRLDDLNAAIIARQDLTMTWEDIGIDSLFIDEADLFKNLGFVTQRDRVKGLPNTQSQRAFDAFVKVQTILEAHHGQGVVFATGTPISNTIAECWTMMRYLMHGTLEKIGMHRFDAWANTYGETSTRMEQAVSGVFVPTERFRRFQNAAELMTLFRQVADVLDPATVELPIPRLLGGKRDIIIAHATDKFWEIQRDIEAREAAIKRGGVNPKDDNMLKLVGDGRKNALFNSDKLQRVAEEVHRIWTETKGDRGAQAILLDLGVPKVLGEEGKKSKAAQEVARRKAENEAAESGQEEPSSGVVSTAVQEALAELNDDDVIGVLTDEEKRAENDAYNRIKDYLVAAGVPREEVVFATEYEGKKLQQVFESVNEGRIRVIVGSTEKIGAGVNIQKRLAALHHVDAPWRPRDVEQREGRLLRQGNEVYGPKAWSYDENDHITITDPGKGVRIFAYATERSMDGFIWQTIDEKIRGINQLMRPGFSERTVEDIQDLSDASAEIRAGMWDNPLIMRRAQVEAELGVLRMLYSSWLTRVTDARSQVEWLPQSIARTRATIAEMERDITLARTAKQVVRVNERTFDLATSDARREAGDALVEQMTKSLGRAIKSIKVGEYWGFDVMIHAEPASYYVDVEPTDRDKQLGIKRRILQQRPGALIGLRNGGHPDGTIYWISQRYDSGDIPTGGLVVYSMTDEWRRLNGSLNHAQDTLVVQEQSLKTYREQVRARFSEAAHMRGLLQEQRDIERSLLPPPPTDEHGNPLAPVEPERLLPTVLEQLPGEAEPTTEEAPQPVTEQVPIEAPSPVAETPVVTAPTEEIPPPVETTPAVETPPVTEPTTTGEAEVGTAPVSEQPPVEPVPPAETMPPSDQTAIARLRREAREGTPGAPPPGPSPEVSPEFLRPTQPEPTGTGPRYDPFLVRYTEPAETRPLPSVTERQTGQVEKWTAPFEKNGMPHRVLVSEDGRTIVEYTTKTGKTEWTRAVEKDGTLGGWLKPREGTTAWTVVKDYAGKVVEAGEKPAAQAPTSGPTRLVPPEPPGAYTGPVTVEEIAGRRTRGALSGTEARRLDQYVKTGKVPGGMVYDEGSRKVVVQRVSPAPAVTAPEQPVTPVEVPPTTQAPEPTATPANAPTTPYTATAFRQDLIGQFHATPEQADAAMALVEARARVLGMAPDEYVAKRVVGTETGQLPTGPAVLQGETRTLPQNEKGAAEFLADGRVVLHALEGADISTVVHELGHVFRRDLPAEDLTIAGEWAGAKDGVWDIAAEEKFARGFERYLADGSAPSDALRAVFQKFKEWLANIYRSIQGSAIDVNLTDEVRGVFDRMLSETPLPRETAAAETTTPEQPAPTTEPVAAEQPPAEVPAVPAEQPAEAAQPPATTPPTPPTGTAPAEGVPDDQVMFLHLVGTGYWSLPKALAEKAIAAYKVARPGKEKIGWDESIALASQYAGLSPKDMAELWRDAPPAQITADLQVVRAAAAENMAAIRKLQDALKAEERTLSDVDKATMEGRLADLSTDQAILWSALNRRGGEAGRALNSLKIQMRVDLAKTIGRDYGYLKHFVDQVSAEVESGDGKLNGRARQHLEDLLAILEHEAAKTLPDVNLPGAPQVEEVAPEAPPAPISPEARRVADELEAQEEGRVTPVAEPAPAPQTTPIPTGDEETLAARYWQVMTRRGQSVEEERAKIVADIEAALAKGELTVSLAGEPRILFQGEIAGAPEQPAVPSTPPVTPRPSAEALAKIAAIRQLARERGYEVGEWRYDAATNSVKASLRKAGQAAPVIQPTAPVQPAAPRAKSPMAILAERVADADDRIKAAQKAGDWEEADRIKAERDKLAEQLGALVRERMAKRPRPAQPAQPAPDDVTRALVEKAGRRILAEQKRLMAEGEEAPSLSEQLVVLNREQNTAREAGDNAQVDSIEEDRQVLLGQLEEQIREQVVKRLNRQRPDLSEEELQRIVDQKMAKDIERVIARRVTRELTGEGVFLGKLEKGVQKGAETDWARAQVKIIDKMKALGAYDPELDAEANVALAELAAASGYADVQVRQYQERVAAKGRAPRLAERIVEIDHRIKAARDAGNFDDVARLQAEKAPLSTQLTEQIRAQVREQKAKAAADTSERDRNIQRLRDQIAQARRDGRLADIARLLSEQNTLEEQPEPVVSAQPALSPTEQKMAEAELRGKLIRQAAGRMQRTLRARITEEESGYGRAQAQVERQVRRRIDQDTARETAALVRHILGLGSIDYEYQDERGQTVKTNSRRLAEGLAREHLATSHMTGMHWQADMAPFAQALAEHLRDVGQQSEQVTREYLAMANQAQIRKLMPKNATPEQIAEIGAEMAKVDWADPRAAGRFASTLADPKAWDYIHAARVSSMLTGPRTLTLDFLSSVLEATSKIPTRVMAPIVEIPLARAQGRESAATFRMAAAELMGQVHAVTLALDEWRKTFTTGVSSMPLRNIGTYKADILSSRFKPLNAALWPLNRTLRIMGATGDFARTLSEAGSIEAYATLISQRTGKGVDYVKANMADYAWVLERAGEEGRRSAFMIGHEKDQGKFIGAVQRFRQTALGKIAIPMFETAASITQMGLERTPLGLLKAGQIVGRAKAEAQARGETEVALGTYEHAALVRGAALLGFGLTAIGYGMALAGTMTAFGPSDPDERKEWLARGGQTFAVKIGDKWVKWNNLSGAWAVPLALGCALGEAQTAAIKGLGRGALVAKPLEQQVTDAVTTFAGTTFSETARFWIEMNSLRGVLDIIQATVDPNRYARQAAEGLTTSFVPYGGFLAAVARATDPEVKDPEGLIQVIAARQPGWSKSIPPALTPLGNPRQRADAGALTFLPFPLGQIEQDPLYDELGRLRERGFSVNIDVSGKTLQGVPLSHEEQVLYERTIGQKVHELLGKAITSANYQKATNGQKAVMLQTLMAMAKAQAGAQTRKEIGASTFMKRVLEMNKEDRRRLLEASPAS
ncbi:MAG: hypothetical protein QG671_3512, partial [Actinomycetota bacterium]|nr:hypothetical protein [Actinomycetota bacterium]